MGQRHNPGVTRESTVAQQMRDQEVLRASRDLAAYFKGRRTEREARDALRIIKAFVRDREHQDAGSRRPLPGAHVATMPKEATDRKAPRDGGARHQRKPRRKPHGALSKSATAAIEPQVDRERPQSQESDEQTPD